MADETGQLHLGDRCIELPVTTGSEGERAVDIQRLRQETGTITLDPGYGNTGSCRSAITFIDGEQGILRYRGYPIEALARKSTFVEVAWLLIFGDLPRPDELERFSGLLTKHQMMHERMYKAFDGFPSSGHPMAILSAMINATSCYHPEIIAGDESWDFADAAARIISKTRTIAAASYKTSIGQPIIYPRPDYDYCANFLHMMFSRPYAEITPDEDVVRALNMILVLHADHEQNCSTSTVRMVASSHASLFASAAAGVCALWGPRHGGANAAVIDMLEQIHGEGLSVKRYIQNVKSQKTGIRLMGFGHRVYKNYDPRAKIIKEQADVVLDKLGIDDPLLDIARTLEEAALSDDYFRERNLYPNVDFYSGILMRAIGIPVNMFTVMFAIGRMAGWVANFREVHEQGSRIYRPRQVYTGEAERPYMPIEER